MAITVDIFIPCFVDQLYPATALNMVKVLERLGVKINYNPNQTCCGQPAYNAGHHPAARAVANKFLDDLRGADVLLHVIDASGTTNERGEKTVNYDPCCDADWLKKEIEDWIFNNLWPRWATIARRHGATKKPVAITLQSQLGGYGARKTLTSRLCDKLGLVDPVDLAVWDKEKVRDFVK